MFLHHRIILKRTMSRIVHLLVHTACLTDDTVSGFKSSDGRTDLDNFAGVVVTKDKRVLDPGEHHGSHFNLDPTDRVDYYGVVFDGDFVREEAGLGS